MRYFNSTLMNSQQPAFQQRNNNVGRRQKIFPNTGGFFTDYIMGITKFMQLIISVPIICANYRVRFNAMLYSIVQTFCRSIKYTFQANSSNTFPILLCRNEHQCIFQSKIDPLFQFNFDPPNALSLRRF